MKEKKDGIYQLAVIDKVIKGGAFVGHLSDNPAFVVNLRLCGKMVLSKITIAAGDMVKVELSPYDLTQGRIIWRC